MTDFENPEGFNVQQPPLGGKRCVGRNSLDEGDRVIIYYLFIIYLLFIYYSFIIIYS